MVAADLLHVPKASEAVTSAEAETVDPEEDDERDRFRAFGLRGP